MPAAFFATEPSTIFLDLKNDTSCEFFCYLTQIWDYGPESYKYERISYY